MANIIGIIISILLIVALTHPQWLPFSAETAAKIQDLRAEHFLIERSGKITLAHFATLILALAVVWLIFTIIKILLQIYSKRDDHSATIGLLLTGMFRYLAVIAAFIWGLSILGVNTTAVLAGAGFMAALRKT